MGLLTLIRKGIFSEETRFRAAVSESVAQKIGSAVNFINFRQFDEKSFRANGPYGDAAVFPVIGLDGLYVLPFDAEIFGYFMYNEYPGTGGTTEFDVKLATTSGGTFTSIFSVTPKINSTASAETFCLGYIVTETTTTQIYTVNPSPPTGVTVGTFTSVPFQVNAGDAIRVDVISGMPSAQNGGLVLLHRPR